MKKMIVVAVSALALALVIPLMAEDHPGPDNFRGVVNFDKGAKVQIDGTLVTSSAAELNILDGCTATAANLNATKTGFVSTISAAIVRNANGGTNVVTVTAKSLDGVTVAAPYAFRVWITDEPNGALAAVAGDFAVNNGMELQQVLDKGDYWVVATNVLGTASFTITDTPPGTNYIHVLSPSGFRTTSTSVFVAQ